MALIVVQSAIDTGGGLLGVGNMRTIPGYSGEDILDVFKDKAMSRLDIDPARATFVTILGPLDALDPTNLTPFLGPALLHTDPVKKMSEIVVPRGGAGGGAYYFVVASPSALFSGG